jgi:hypothetical protein
MFFAGCATTSSGVHKIGSDTYNVTVAASLGMGGLSGAKRNAYEEANQECSRQEKEIFVVTEKVERPNLFNGMHSVDLNFKCLTISDP